MGTRTGWENVPDM
jgi:hypothetical protein